MRFVARVYRGGSEIARQVPSDPRQVLKVVIARHGLEESSFKGNKCRLTSNPRETLHGGGKQPERD